MRKNTLLKLFTMLMVFTLGLPLAASAEDTVYTAEDAVEAVEINAELTPPSVSARRMPEVPVMGTGDIIEIANAALNEFGPKFAVYPRVMDGGDYTPEMNRDEWREAVMAGFDRLYGTGTDEWSVFSYPGSTRESGAWFYPLTEETENLVLLEAGMFTEVVHDMNGRREIESPVFRLDAMMAVNLTLLDNMAARSLPKNPGVLSFVLNDGETEGGFAVAFSVTSMFRDNYTGGDPDLVPAVIMNGMPGAPVDVRYCNLQGCEEVEVRVEATNGTLSVEVPTNGFVLLSVPVRGDSENSNTEVLVRMGSQPLSDTPSKNWVADPR